MKKTLIIIGCAFAALTTHAQRPDAHEIAREIQRQTGSTYWEAHDIATSWAKRNGYEY